MRGCRCSPLSCLSTWQSSHLLHCPVCPLLWSQPGLWHTWPSQAQSLVGYGFVFCGPGFSWRALLRDVQEEMRGDVSLRSPAKHVIGHLLAWGTIFTWNSWMNSHLLLMFPRSPKIGLLRNEGWSSKTFVQSNFTYEMVRCWVYPGNWIQFYTPSTCLARKWLIRGIQVVSVEWVNAPRNTVLSPTSLTFNPVTMHFRKKGTQPYRPGLHRAKLSALA